MDHPIVQYTRYNVLFIAIIDIATHHLHRVRDSEMRLFPHTGMCPFSISLCEPLLRNVPSRSVGSPDIALSHAAIIVSASVESMKIDQSKCSSKSGTGISKNGTFVNQVPALTHDSSSIGFSRMYGESKGRGCTSMQLSLCCLLVMLLHHGVWTGHYFWRPL